MADNTHILSTRISGLEDAMSEVTLLLKYQDILYGNLYSENM
jgi:hypothetical protein